MLPSVRKVDLRPWRLLQLYALAAAVPRHAEDSLWLQDARLRSISVSEQRLCGNLFSLSHLSPLPHRTNRDFEPRGGRGGRDRGDWDRDRGRGGRRDFDRDYRGGSRDYRRDRDYGRDRDYSRDRGYSRDYPARERDHRGYDDRPREEESRHSHHREGGDDRYAHGHRDERGYPDEPRAHGDDYGDAPPPPPPEEGHHHAHHDHHNGGGGDPYYEGQRPSHEERHAFVDQQ